MINISIRIDGIIAVMLVVRSVVIVQALINHHVKTVDLANTFYQTKPADIALMIVPLNITSKLAQTVYPATKPVRPATVSPVQAVTPVSKVYISIVDIADMSAPRKHSQIVKPILVLIVILSVNFVLVQLLIIVRVVRQD